MPLLVLFGFFFYMELQNRIEEIKQGERTNVTLGRYALNDSLTSKGADLRLLADLFKQNYKQSRKRFISSQIKLFTSVIAQQAGYDQIRFIDNNGQEIIRVNRRYETVNVVKNKRLQNKKDRYYVKDIQVLGEGEIYVSPMDLNVEDGQIEIPITPTVRLGTPIFDVAGRRTGMLVININGTYLMSSLSAISRGIAHPMSLLNKNGYWLLERDPDKTWGFMFGNNQRFQTYYPQLWNKIQSSQRGQLVNQEGGVFTYDSIYPLIVASQSSVKVSSFQENESEKKAFYWKIVTRISPEKLLDIQKEMFNRFFSMAVPLVVLLMLISWKLARARMRHHVSQVALQAAYTNLEQKVEERTLALRKEVEFRKQTEERMRHMASYDNLTGIPNRALFDDRLRTVLTLNRRHKKIIALMFIDLDGFKQVNDSYGHDCGDQLLIQVSHRLSKQIRESDTVGRYGGDEFVVLLNDIAHLGDADFIAIEVIQSLSERFLINENEVILGCSIGIAIHRGEVISIKEFIKIADEAMYSVKKNGKNNFKRVEVSSSNEDVYYI